MRFALFATAALLVSSVETGARAQIPVFQAEPQAPSEPVPALEPAPPDAEPASVPTPDPAVVAPPAATLSPPSANAPAPARVEVLTEPPPSVRHEPDDDEDEAGELGPRRRWYGWQTLTADGIDLGVLILAGSTGDRGTARDVGTGLVWFGLLSYELTPGFIHFVHHNPGRGFASFGMRFGLPLTGAIIGASAAGNCEDCAEAGAGAGILLGMAGAIAIDAAVFAYDDDRRAAPARASLVPLLSVTQRRAWIGLGGEL